VIKKWGNPNGGESGRSPGAGAVSTRPFLKGRKERTAAPVLHVRQKRGKGEKTGKKRGRGLVIPCRGGATIKQKGEKVRRKKKFTDGTPILWGRGRR